MKFEDDIVRGCRYILEYMFTYWHACTCDKIIDKLDDILQTPFWKGHFWLKTFEFSRKFHWNMFLIVYLTTCHHWFRWWLGIEQATSRHPNQWRLILLMHICVTRPQWVKQALHQRSGGRQPISFFLVGILFQCVPARWVVAATCRPPSMPDRVPSYRQPPWSPAYPRQPCHQGHLPTTGQDGDYITYW